MLGTLGTFEFYVQTFHCEVDYQIYPCNHHHVPFLKPKWPLAGIGRYDTPSPSAVLRKTVFPHQSGNEYPG